MAIGQQGPDGLASGPHIAPRLVEDRPGGQFVVEQALDLPAEVVSAGVWAAQLDAPGFGYVNRIERLLIETNSTTATTCTLLVGGQRRSYTDLGNLNERDFWPTLLQPGDKPLVFRWEGYTQPAGQPALLIAHVQFLTVGTG